VEGKDCGIMCGNIPAFAWRSKENNLLSQMDSVLIKIRTGHLHKPETYSFEILHIHNNIFFLAIVIYYICITNVGARGSIVVKALCYKPEDRRFDTR
jgi:hypothetical protein